jgi:hypothetical protein
MPIKYMIMHVHLKFLEFGTNAYIKYNHILHKDFNF